MATAISNLQARAELAASRARIAAAADEERLQPPASAVRRALGPEPGSVLDAPAGDLRALPAASPFDAVPSWGNSFG